jgi:F-type H+-transporting ATPase subunit b
VKEEQVLKRITALLSLVAAVLIPALAFAASGGGADAGGHHGLPWMDFFLRVVNFALVIGIIWYFAGKQIKEFFVGRQYQIKADLEDLSTRRKEAETKLAEVEKSIANLETERQEILKEYAAQGEALKASIVAEAEKKAEAVRAQAKVAVAQESRQAIDKLKADMAEKVVEAAEALLKEKLDADTQQKLIKDSLAKVVMQ